MHKMHKLLTKHADHAYDYAVEHNCDAARAADRVALFYVRQMWKAIEKKEADRIRFVKSVW